MIIRKRPCIPSKATTTTSPDGGFLRDACNDAPFSIDGISPMRKLSPGDTSLQALQTQCQGLLLVTGVSVGAICCPGNDADGGRGSSSGGNWSGGSCFHLCQRAKMMCWRAPANGTERNPQSNPKSSAPAKRAKMATMG